MGTRRYTYGPEAIGWETDDPEIPKGETDDCVLFEVAKEGIDVWTSSAPILTRQNATDLRDWLTAWLERTK